MDINPEIRERILNAAQQLFDASGRLELPTVDAVRRFSTSQGSSQCRSQNRLLPGFSGIRDRLHSFAMALEKVLR
jgi:hypothetical protein